MIRLQLGIRYSIGRVNQVPVVPVATTTPSGDITTVPQAVEVRKQAMRAVLLGPWASDQTVMSPGESLLLDFEAEDTEHPVQCIEACASRSVDHPPRCAAHGCCQCMLEACP